jgi:hypothetical protein
MASSAYMAPVYRNGVVCPAAPAAARPERPLPAKSGHSLPGFMSRSNVTRTGSRCLGGMCGAGWGGQPEAPACLTLWWQLYEIGDYEAV